MTPLQLGLLYLVALAPAVVIHFRVKAATKRLVVQLNDRLAQLYRNDAVLATDIRMLLRARPNLTLVQPRGPGEGLN
jgi:hypothetical protein